MAYGNKAIDLYYYPAKDFLYFPIILLFLKSIFQDVNQTTWDHKNYPVQCFACAFWSAPLV